MSDKPLFQGMDEKERELAPQQVPGDPRPELDASETDTGERGILPVLPDSAGSGGAQPGTGTAGVLPVAAPRIDDEPDDTTR
jgi:hypothetical protein